MNYKYVWGNNKKRSTMKGRECSVLARGKMNSILIEFRNGQKEIVSRYSIRKINTPGKEITTRSGKQIIIHNLIGCPSQHKEMEEKPRQEGQEAVKDLPEAREKRKTMSTNQRIKMHRFNNNNVSKNIVSFIN